MFRCVLAAFATLSVCTSALAGPSLPTILVTGYWPPTNNMVRAFNPNPAQNPTWIGGNWESRGYNIVSYHPEFPGQTGPNWGKGEGDFEVDYQDTDADFARIVADVKPVAILSFSRASTNIGWELEPAYQRWRLPGEAITPGTRAVPTYAADYFGTPNPNGTSIVSEPLGFIRMSNLPMQTIVNDVRSAIPSLTDITPFIDAFDPNSISSSAFSGNFLSGFLPYLAARYRDNNQPGLSLDPCYISGHIHVGTNLNPLIAEQATMTTLRTITGYLDTIVPAPPALAMFAPLTLVASRRRRG